MGGGTYSEDESLTREAHRRATNTPAFEYSRDVNRGHDDSGKKVARQIHPNLKIHGQIRKSLDFSGEPSLPIAIFLDVTGSMSGVPIILQQRLPSLLSLMYRERLAIEKPQILFGAIGDSRCDNFPIQIGQFEADNRMEDDMLRILLEGGGGSSPEESYELALYFLGSRTQLDHFDKRGKKGYAFIFGDELVYPSMRRADLTNLFGVPAEKDLPLEELVRAAQEKFHLFFIIPGGTSGSGRGNVFNRWTELLGVGHVLKLENPILAAATIGLTIGLTEGTIPTLEAGIGHLRNESTPTYGILHSTLATTAKVMEARRLKAMS